MDTPYAVQPGHVAWWEIAVRAEGEALTQGAATAYSSGHDDWQAHPAVTPQMPFVNGALGRVVVDGARQEVTQTLV